MAETLADDLEFDALFEGTIKPAVAPFEADRQALVKTYFMKVSGCITVAVMMFFAQRFIPAIVAFGLIVLCMIGFALSYGPLGDFTKRCKTAILSRLAESLGLTYIEKFDPPGFATMCRLHLLPSHDRASFEDMFMGHRHGCPFELYEAKLEDKRTDSDKDDKWVTVFEGQIIKIPYPKAFLGTTVVVRDGVRLKGRDGLQPVGLGASQFEKVFDCFGTDQVEARFLVHPAFMERLLALENGRSGSRVRCGFHDGDLMIAVDGANLFEVVKVFKPVPDKDLTEAGVTQIRQILSVIDVVMAPPPKAY